MTNVIATRIGTWYGLMYREEYILITVTGSYVKYAAFTSELSPQYHVEFQPEVLQNYTHSLVWDGETYKQPER